MTTRIVKVKKASIAAFMLWGVLLCLRCKEVAQEIPDPCKPEIDEVFEVKVVFDYYRIKVEKPDAPDLAFIYGSFTDYWTKPMAKIGKDHFQYTCMLRANSNPKTEANAYYVAVDDFRRGVEESMASERITVNDTELTKRAYATSWTYKVFWLDKCKVITK